MEIELEKIGLMKQQLDEAMDVIIKACGDADVTNPGDYYPRVENLSQDDLQTLWYKVSEAWEIAYKTVNGPLTVEALEIDMSMPEDK